MGGHGCTLGRHPVLQRILSSCLPASSNPCRIPHPQLTQQPLPPLPSMQFEKEAEEADPFGLDAFLSDVRGGKKKGALDDIGKRGGMGAGGGGGSYEDQHAGGSGRRREFVSGGR